MSSHDSLTQTGAAIPAGRPSVSGRFVAGTVLANRYRIVTLLGCGGMGEVYKADDLRLDQPVALKFLPSSLAMRPEALARLHTEVRTARQVSHPNVCRVYDIGEVDGASFLSMEFIDGDDLSSLLRRIGRLPSGKASEIARQLCAGLAAVHDAGVLHRDLKPSNVLIDGRGRARIADFGIAALVDEPGRAEPGGTPGYMAPEQLAGEPATERSDIYSLGALLYELFTGKRVVEVGGALDARLYHEGGSPVTPPSTWVPDLPATTEAVILRCLEREPPRRPRSAIVVATALPGGAPLEAALAAGHTPSPEMVAAAGSHEALARLTGIVLFGAAVLMILAGAWLRTQVAVAAKLPFTLPPEVLAHTAHGMIRDFGHPDVPADVAYGFAYNTAALRPAATSGAAPHSTSDAGPSASVLFWYRESPVPLVARYGGNALHSQSGVVTADEPPVVVPGMKLAWLDLSGRLVHFRAPSREFQEDAAAATPLDWSRMFVAAGIDTGTVRQVEPLWFPPVAADTRWAWTGASVGHTDSLRRLEAGTVNGLITGVETLDQEQTGTEPGRSVATVQAGSFAASLIFSTVIVLGTALAWRNVTLGRGDRRGAFRLGVLLAALRFGAWVLEADHTWTHAALQSFWIAASTAILNGILGYGLYLGIEPYIRRRWPTILIAWNRALSGRLTDPLVGYEVLVGIGFAGALALINLSLAYAGGASTVSTNLNAMLGIRRIAAFLLSMVDNAVFFALFTALFVYLLRELLRREWLAEVVLVVTFGGFVASTGYLVGPWWLPIVSGMVMGLSFVLSLTRFGLVALATSIFVWRFLSDAPAFLQASAWYSGISFFSVAAVIGVAVLATLTATGAPWGRTVDPVHV